MQKNAPISKIIYNTSLCLASGFYSGFVKKAPGTAGSLACLVFWYLNSYSLKISQSWLLVGVVFCGLLTTHIVLKHLQKGNPQIKDPQFIVIDEWAGMLVALTAIPENTFIWALTAFALFRLFDITKPLFIGWSERLPGAIGIMADDILAGICALIIFFVMNAFIL